jgi:hypothetical protein
VGHPPTEIGKESSDTATPTITTTEATPERGDLVLKKGGGESSATTDSPKRNRPARGGKGKGKATDEKDGENVSGGASSAPKHDSAEGGINSSAKASTSNGSPARPGKKEKQSRTARNTPPEKEKQPLEQKATDAASPKGLVTKQQQQQQQQQQQRGNQHHKPETASTNHKQSANSLASQVLYYLSLSQISTN